MNHSGSDARCPRTNGLMGAESFIFHAGETYDPAIHGTRKT